jgi:hypothetical protein
MTDTTITPQIIAAIDHTWGAICARHRDVPEVVITFGAGSGSSHELTYGHFAPERWQRGKSRLPEMFVAGEGLSRGARAVLGTLLHEAAHGVAAVRGIKDTSRQGRWHNTRFRALAGEVGIEVSQDPSIGWSVTSVPDATVWVYQAEMRRLETALVAWRYSEVTASGRTNSNNGISVTCDCARRIRLSLSVYEAGPVLCGLCGGAFSE